MSGLSVSPSVALGIGTLATLIGIGFVAYALRQFRLGTSRWTMMKQPLWWLKLLGGLAILAAGIAAIVYQAKELFQRL